MVSTANSPCFQPPQRDISKHWNPKWKKLRTLKVIKVKLPNYQEKPEDLTEDERKAQMRERGVMPPRPWQERPIYLSTVSPSNL